MNPADDYISLTEEHLQHLAVFEFEETFSMLAENVVFRLPDGDTGTRTSFNGLDEVRNFWNNYQVNSGNNKASFS